MIILGLEIFDSTHPLTTMVEIHPGKIVVLMSHLNWSCQNMSECVQPTQISQKCVRILWVRHLKMSMSIKDKLAAKTKRIIEEF